MPLTVMVDASLKSPPNPDSRNLLSWDAADGSGNKVRFLVPVNLYPPGNAVPEALPKDYLTYLQGLTSQGVKLSNVTKVTVDGHPATLMTATTSSGNLDGSLGCPAVGGPVLHATAVSNPPASGMAASAASFLFTSFPPVMLR